jgi:hypothetical protein
MKKVKALLFAFVLAGMSVVSCSSDDDNGPAATIDGKWNQLRTVVKIGNQSGVEQLYEDNVADCEKNYLELAAGGVYNDVVFFKQGGACQQNAATPGSWVKIDNTLSITDGGDLSGTYKIVRLTGSELQISIASNVAGVTTTTTVYMQKAN